MVAGDKEKHLEKLPSLKCDVAMVNLEDGVFDKEGTREFLKEKFKDGIRCDGKKIVVRVNALDECGIEDIKAINTIKPDAIRVPKIRCVEDVEQALAYIHKDIEVHLSIETKEAFDNLKALKLNDRVTTVYLGILDLFESLGFPQSLLSLENPTVDYILSKFIVDSKIAGFYPISFTYQDYKNTEEFKKWCYKVKVMGYTAKATISPTQVDIVNEVFAYDDEAKKKAEYIKKIFEEQKVNGCTGFVDEKYGFIDEPIYKDALLVLRK
jgi:citrate lyase subunit beta/citryl-CoA lyase